MLAILSFVELPQGLRENAFWSEAASSGSVIIVGSIFTQLT